MKVLTSYMINCFFEQDNLNRLRRSEELIVKSEKLTPSPHRPIALSPKICFQTFFCNFKLYDLLKLQNCI